MRKMLVAMAKDIRVLLIKLADRLHNMRTIASLPEAKQQRIAQETLDIYAPLAHRLGIARGEAAARGPRVRGAAPEALRRDRADGRHRRRPSASSTSTQVLDRAPRPARPSCTSTPRSPAGRSTTGRSTRRWSSQGKEFDEIFDLVGIRVIVESVKDCYAALGSIHAMWKPVQGRFKDYIAMPKFNLYQSLHTTVVGPGGQAGRGADPHRRRCTGGPSTASPRTGATRSDEPRRRPASGCSASSTGSRRPSDPGEFMEILKIDLEQDEVFVFTPKGKVDHAADRRDAGRLRLRDPHRGRPPLHRRAGQRPAGAARLRARVGRHRRDLHQQGRGRRPEPRLAAVRRSTPRARNEDPPVVLA